MVQHYPCPRRSTDGAITLADVESVSAETCCQARRLHAAVTALLENRLRMATKARTPVDNGPKELQAGAGTEALPFIYGHVDPALFPIERLQQASLEALGRFGVPALNYGVERGCGPLLEYLQAKLAQGEGLEIEKGNLMLTAGASGGIDALCRLLTEPGDVVLVEAPTYHEALAILRDYPVRIQAIAIDGEGIRVDELEDRVAQLHSSGEFPRFLYTLPTFQNPSSITQSQRRRTALLDIARRWRFQIIEDDVYRDLAYDGVPPPSIYALDAQDNGNSTMCLGSFSKILGPGLRLGWLVGPPATITRITSSGLFASGGGANPYAAFTTAVFCQNGWLEPHIHELVSAYRERRDVMLGALARCMPKDVGWTQPGGGFFVWLTLPEQLLARDVLVKARQQSISFLTGEPFFVGSGGKHHIRLPFSYIPPKEMEGGIATLGEIISDLLGAA
jgi:2-aminoadipate transaminase